MQDRLSLRGRLRVLTIPTDTALVGDALQRALERGHAAVVRDQHNLIVNQGLSVISRFLGNNANAPLINGGAGFADISDITIGSMHLGSAVAPPAPLPTDTVSVSTLVYAPVLTVTYPDAFSIQFSGVIPITELVGTTITEEALRTVSGLVFAKVTLAVPYLKTSGNAVQFDHLISFARG